MHIWKEECGKEARECPQPSGTLGYRTMTLCMGALGNIWEETSTVQVGDWACSQLISPVARCQRLVEKNR